ncbi:MAG: M48 family metalloprotease [Thiohalomonadaceae bacterium]
MKRILSLSILLSGFLLVQGVQAATDARKRMSENVVTLSDLQGDLEAEVSFGRDIAARILGRMKLVDNQPINEYLNLVGHSVARFGSRPEVNYRFALVDSDSINAYAAPGGYIFITTGAFALMQDEAELAAVLAHEVAHVNQRHIVNALGIRGSEQGAEAGLSRLIGGATDTVRVAFEQAIDKAVQILFDEGLKQADEMEADHLGVVTAALAGYDPQAMTRYLARIEAQRGEETAILYKTHPPMAQRQQAIGELIQTENLLAVGSARGQSRFSQIQGMLNNE